MTRLAAVCFADCRYKCTGNSQVRRHESTKWRIAVVAASELRCGLSTVLGVMYLQPTHAGTCWFTTVHSGSLGACTAKVHPLDNSSRSTAMAGIHLLKQCITIKAMTVAPVILSLLYMTLTVSAEPCVPDRYNTNASR